MTCIVSRRVDRHAGTSQAFRCLDLKYICYAKYSKYAPYICALNRGGGIVVSNVTFFSENPSSSTQSLTLVPQFLCKIDHCYGSTHFIPLKYLPTAQLNVYNIPMKRLTWFSEDSLGLPQWGCLTSRAPSRGRENWSGFRRQEHRTRQMCRGAEKRFFLVLLKCKKTVIHYLRVKFKLSFFNCLLHTSIRDKNKEKEARNGKLKN